HQPPSIHVFGGSMTSSTGPIIEVRNAFTITVTNGHLTNHLVPTPCPAGPGGIVEINIVGEVRFVDHGALMKLGVVLADAERVIVRANGSGLDYLHTEIVRTIKTEQSFRASDTKSRNERRASIDRQIAGGYLPADYWELEGGE
ncbi:hypothetical protein, partial [Nocardiopsis sp. TNDT3]|uniref:hypothetical protein n=1 Tax=Nocardiopsis sp. TNDT3 TaxID=2249354 RepID=UPI001E4B8C84